MERETNQAQEPQEELIRLETIDSSASSEDSDFRPISPEMLRRTLSRLTAPLPAGVKDVGWSAPNASGLRHSHAIFHTKPSESGQNTQVVMNSGQSHFRQWQEDNGVANVHGTEKVESVVDGKLMTVRLPKRLTEPSLMFNPSTMGGLAQQAGMVSPSSEANSTSITSSPTDDATAEHNALNDPVDEANCLQVTTKSNGLLDMGCGRSLVTTSESAAGKDSAKVEQSRGEGEVSKAKNVPHRPASTRRSRSPSPTRGRHTYSPEVRNDENHKYRRSRRKHQPSSVEPAPASCMSEVW